jgi:serine/threonine-protein kinase 24/25/MST4
MDSSQFKLGEVIGAGSFGEVKKAVRLATNEEVAIKILDLETVRDELDNIQKEISLLSRLDSVYVVQYLGSFLHGTNLNVVMEYMSGGSLRDLMKSGPLQEQEIAVVLREVLSGLCFLHGANVVHRDIKAANILVNASGKVKIADFGVARELNATKRKLSVVGSPYWMAPEVITAKEGGFYNEKADIWSLGITAIELATGFPPRSSEKPLKVLFSIPNSPPPKLEGAAFSASFKDFISTCLKFKPSERPSAKELLSHQFLAQTKDSATLLPLLERHKSWKASQPQSAATNATSSSSTSNSSTSKVVGGAGTGGVGGTAGGGNGLKSQKPSSSPIPIIGTSSLTSSNSKRNTFKMSAKHSAANSSTAEASASDSTDDWDLSSTTKTSSPVESINASESTPTTPRGTGLLAKGSSKLGASIKARPPLSVVGLRRPAEFSTLSASTDENQFGSVIVHQVATDSESSSHAPANSGHLGDTIDENDAGEEDDASASMTEQQFGSVVIKSVKKRETASSATTSIKDSSSAAAALSSKESPSSISDRKKKASAEASSLNSPSTNGGTSSGHNSRPRAATDDPEATTDASKPLKRDRSKPKLEPGKASSTASSGGNSATAPMDLPLSAIPAESADSIHHRRPKSVDRGNQSGSLSSPTLKDRKSKDKDSRELKESKDPKEAKEGQPAGSLKDPSATSTRPKKKKIITSSNAGVPTHSAHGNISANNPEASPSDSAIILHHMLLPTLAKKQLSISSDKLAALSNLFSSIESENPGFAADFVVGLIRSFERDQRALSTVGVHVIHTSGREEQSELAKYLITRWKSKSSSQQSPPSKQHNDDSYFL